MLTEQQKMSSTELHRSARDVAQVSVSGFLFVLLFTTIAKYGGSQLTNVDNQRSNLFEKVGIFQVFYFMLQCSEIKRQEN